MPALSVAVLAYPGVDDLDLFGGYAVLAKAAELDPPAADAPALQVRIVAAAREVRTSGGVVVGVRYGLDRLAEADAVLIPGGRGAAAAAADEDVLRALRSTGAQRAHVYSVCSGALLVAAAGLARGRSLAIHGTKQDTLVGHGVVPARGMVRDGPLVSAGGDVRESVKSVDLAFRLLDDLFPGAAVKVAARMELLPGRTLADASQGGPK